ncbi:unnamed protein product [Rotaria sp. Silwood2]|nr:unnamed protein product [Rotaria sp. Silwood2]CAF4532455.1 unnamed protein product [Rotaria sp. Silwood2]
MTTELTFEYIDEDSIDRLLKCRICSKPFIDPVITRDGGRFCRICIIQKASPNDSKRLIRQSSFIEDLVPIKEKILLDMLDDLQVKCTKCQQINNRRVHLEEHIPNKCLKRIVLCDASDLKCPWTGPYEERYNHMKQCIFQLLRPILTEVFQYRRAYDEQQHEIEQLKTQVKLYEDRTEKLQKGYTIFLELLSQQTRRCAALEKDIQEIREQSNAQYIQPIELKNEIEQLKQSYHQINIPSDGFQTEFHRLNQLEQSIDDLSKKYQQLNEKYQKQEHQNQNANQQLDEQCQNEISQLKEQVNQQMIQFNTFQDESQQLKEQFNQQMIQFNKRQTEINQLQKESQSRKKEIMYVEQKCNEHGIQIHLLARKRCVIQTILPHHDGRVEALITPFVSDSEINLDRQLLNDQDMEIICKNVIIDKRCSKLRLENNDISAKGATILANGLYGNTTLVDLQLSNNRISDMGAHALAQVLSINNFTLELLELHWNGITDVGAEYLAEMLKTNKTITLLGLGFNRIGNRGVRLLTSAITCYNETLQWLDLSSNKLITDACVNDLIEMFKQNRSLHAVWLNDCSLSQDGVEKLKQVVNSKANFTLEV